jgi:hypothetical protein
VVVGGAVVVEVEDLDAVAEPVGERARVVAVDPGVADVERHAEGVADHAERMARTAADRSEPPGEAFAAELESTADRARSVVESASDAVLVGADVTDAHRALSSRDDLVADLESIERRLYDRASAAGGLRAGLLLEASAERREVAELAIQRAVRESRDD